MWTTSRSYDTRVDLMSEEQPPFAFILCLPCSHHSTASFPSAFFHREAPLGMTIGLGSSFNTVNSDQSFFCSAMVSEDVVEVSAARNSGEARRFASVIPGVASSVASGQDGLARRAVWWPEELACEQCSAGGNRL